MRYYYVHKAVQFAVGVLVIVCLLSVGELCHDNQRGTAVWLGFLQNSSKTRPSVYRWILEEV